MQEAIKQSKRNKILAVLRCKKNVEKYYKNFKWKDVGQRIKFNDNKKLTSMIYPVSKFKKKDFLNSNLAV